MAEAAAAASSWRRHAVSSRRTKPSIQDPRSGTESRKVSCSTSGALRKARWMTVVVAPTQTGSSSHTDFARTGRSRTSDGRLFRRQTLAVTQLVPCRDTSERDVHQHTGRHALQLCLQHGAVVSIRAKSWKTMNLGAAAACVHVILRRYAQSCLRAWYRRRWPTRTAVLGLPKTLQVVLATTEGGEVWHLPEVLHALWRDLRDIPNGHTFVHLTLSSVKDEAGMEPACGGVCPNSERAPRLQGRPLGRILSGGGLFCFSVFLQLRIFVETRPRPKESGPEDASFISATVVFLRFFFLMVRFGSAATYSGSWCDLATRSDLVLEMLMTVCCLSPICKFSDVFEHLSSGS